MPDKRVQILTDVTRTFIELDVIVGFFQAVKYDRKTPGLDLVVEEAQGLLSTQLDSVGSDFFFKHVQGRGFGINFASGGGFTFHYTSRDRQLKINIGLWEGKGPGFLLIGGPIERVIAAAEATDLEDVWIRQAGEKPANAREAAERPNHG